MALALSLLTGGNIRAGEVHGAAAAERITWGTSNFVSPGGWGRMINIAHSDWLCVHTRFNGTNSILQLRLSRDSARTWVGLSMVEEGARFMDNGELIQLTNGPVLLTGRSLVEGQSYRLPVYRSADRGQTWKYWSNIDANEGPPGTLKGRGLWEPHFYQLRDGRLAVAYANEKHAAENPAFSQVCSLRISEDQGEHWGAEIMLAAEPGGGSLRPGMPVVTRMADGRFIAVYEVVDLGDADVYYKTSPDGEHWPPGLGQQIPGHHAGPWITSLTHGRLLLVSCANVVSCSDDYGRTWHSTGAPPWDVGSGKIFTWPAIYQTGIDEVAVMVAWHGVKLRFGNLGRGL